MGNVRHFRRIRKNDALFSENVRFSWKFSELVGNLQNLPMGNVRHFRRIHKNDVHFLKMCAFREHVLKLCVFRKQLVNLCVFSWNLVNSWWKFNELFGESTNSTHGKRASFSQISQKWRPFSENVRFSPKLSDFRKKTRFSWKHTRFSWNYSRIFEFRCTAYVLPLS